MGMFRSLPARSSGDVSPAVLRRYAWHSHDFREVMSLTATPEQGLSISEVRKRRERYGANMLHDVARSHRTLSLRSVALHPLFWILTVLWFLSIARYFDAQTLAWIGIVITFLVVLGLTAERGLVRTLDRIRSARTRRAIVIREGKRQVISANDLVIGDIVELRPGSEVPATMRIIAAKNLNINESALTGEWYASKKHARAVPALTPIREQTSMAWSGTFVVHGKGRGVIVKTSAMVAHEESIDSYDYRTVLEEAFRHFHIAVYIFVAILAVGGAVVGVTRFGSGLGLLLSVISVLLASIPLYLPFIQSIVLGQTLKRIEAFGIQARSRYALLTASDVTHLMIDKTELLTTGSMSIMGVVHEGDITGQSSEWETNPFVFTLIDHALAATDAFVDMEHGTQVLRGDPVDRAILEAALDIGVTTYPQALIGRRIDHVPFSSERRIALGLVTVPGGGHRLCITGAPEYLLEMATRVEAQGGPKRLESSGRADYYRTVQRYAESGKQLVAVAYKEVAIDTIPENHEELRTLLRGLTMQGLMIFEDELRLEARRAVDVARALGMTILLHTGDTASAALRIAQSLGIASPDTRILTGTDMAQLSDAELTELSMRTGIFAEMVPSDKVRIISALQSVGAVVGVTGDDQSDIPTFRRANIGITLASASDAAKDAADAIVVSGGLPAVIKMIAESARAVDVMRRGSLIAATNAVVAGCAMLILMMSSISLTPLAILISIIVSGTFANALVLYSRGEVFENRIHDEGALFPEQIRWFAFFTITVRLMLFGAFVGLVSLVTLSVPLIHTVVALYLFIDMLGAGLVYTTTKYSLAYSISRRPWRALVVGIVVISALTAATTGNIIAMTPYGMVVLVGGLCLLALLFMEFGKKLFLRHLVILAEAT